MVPCGNIILFVAPLESDVGSWECLSVAFEYQFNNAFTLSELPSSVRFGTKHGSNDKLSSSFALLY